MFRTDVCSRLFEDPTRSEVEIGSRATRNQLLVAVLQQANRLQRTDPNADFLIEDPSYLERPHDTDAKAAAREFYSKPKGEYNFDAYASRRNFSSRLFFILAELIQEGLFFNAHAIWDRHLKPAFICRLTPRGLELSDNAKELEAKYPVPRDDSCFVIMSFSDDKHLADYYRFGINAAVEAAGYSCTRVDEIEHNRRITDLILQQIESARFIVADLTQARPNCYYELGWAHRAGKDVIPTVHADTPIHFDVKDYNFIVYESAAELHDRLYRRILKSVGKRSTAHQNSASARTTRRKSSSSNVKRR